jgi:hypothetical protein
VAKSKAGRTRKLAAKSAAKKSNETTEFVVTLNVPERKVAKVECVDNSGKRQTLSALEFARLIAGDEVEDFAAALDEAYDAGIADGIEEAFLVESGEPRETRVRNVESISERIMGAEERHLPPRRAELSGAAGKRAHAGGNGSHRKR